MWKDDLSDNASYNVHIVKLDGAGFEEREILIFQIGIHRDEDFVDCRVVQEDEPVAPEDMILVIRAIEDAAYMALVRKRALAEIQKAAGREFKKPKRGRPPKTVNTPQREDGGDDIPF